MALLKVHKNEKQKIMNIDNLDEPILHISISSRFISNVKFNYSSTIGFDNLWTGTKISGSTQSYNHSIVLNKIVKIILLLHNE